MNTAVPDVPPILIFPVKRNPAFMMRQISDIVSAHAGVTFRITSLNPVQPANKPDELERGRNRTVHFHEDIMEDPC